MIGNFIRDSRQRNDILQSWQASEGGRSELYFDGYNFSGGSKPFQEVVQEVVQEVRQEGAHQTHGLVTVTQSLLSV